MTKYLNTKPGSIEELAANISKHQNESGYQDMFKKELEKAGKGIGAMTPAEKKAFFNKIDDKYKAKKEDIEEAVDNPYAVGMAVAKKMKNDEPPLKKSTITKAHDIAKSITKDDKKEEIKEGYGEQVIKAAKMYMKDNSCTYEMAAEKYGCSVNEVKKCVESYKKDETHSFMTKDMNKSKKDAEGEKEIVKSEDLNSKDKPTVKDVANGLKKAVKAHGQQVKDLEKAMKTEADDHGDKINQKKLDAVKKGEKEIVDPEPKLKQESIQDAIANVWKMSAEELEKIKNEAKYMKAQRMSQYKAEDEKNKKGTADTGSKETKVDVEPKVDYKN